MDTAYAQRFAHWIHMQSCIPMGCAPIRVLSNCCSCSTSLAPPALHSEVRAIHRGLRDHMIALDITTFPKQSRASARGIQRLITTMASLPLLVFAQTAPSPNVLPSYLQNTACGLATTICLVTSALKIFP